MPASSTDCQVPGKPPETLAALKPMKGPRFRNGTASHRPDEPSANIPCVLQATRALEGWFQTE